MKAPYSRVLTKDDVATPSWDQVGEMFSGMIPLGYVITVTVHAPPEPTDPDQLEMFADYD